MNIAPTLVASRTTLPPEGAGLGWGGPARRPRLTSVHPEPVEGCSPEGAVPPKGGLSAERVAHFWIIPFVQGTTS